MDFLQEKFFKISIAMMMNGKQKMSVFPGMQHEVGNKNIQDREAQTNNKIMGGWWPNLSEA